jgi:S-DNA-T family DNA segregation ATPase FtsK/SpoIIIE
LIIKSSPDDLRLILIDPKMVEFRSYSFLPHLLTPIITDAKSAAAALNWATDEMERRYSLIEHLNVRNIDAYNDKVKADPSLGIPEPKIVIVIDELADLMIQLRDPIEALIMRISQKARAAGIHLIVATQRPAVSVITGAIKANIPTRICFKVTSQVDSRVVLDMKGAENLLNRGDMLYWPVSSSAPMRAQCAYISDSEIAEIVATASEEYPDSAFKTAVADYISQSKNKYTCSSFYETEEDDCDGSESFLSDQCFLDAVEIAIASKKISTSLLQRKLSIGYGKAAKYIDAMEELGIISEPRGQKPREVLMTSEEWTKKLSLLE